MPIPTIYTWKDNLAPQLTSTDSTSVANWLTTIMETGYDDKPAMGWTVTQNGEEIWLEQGGTGEKINVKIDHINNVSEGSFKRRIEVGGSQTSFLMSDIFLNENENYQAFGPAGSWNPMETFSSQGYTNYNTYYNYYYGTGIDISPNDGSAITCRAENGDWSLRHAVTIPFDPNSFAAGGQITYTSYTSAASNIYAVCWNHDGTNLIAYDGSDNGWFVFSCAAYTTSSLAYRGETSPGGAWTATMFDQCMSSNGQYFYGVNGGTGVYRWTLATPGDMLTISNNHDQWLDLNISGALRGVDFSSDGHFMLITETQANGGSGHLYWLHDAWNLYGGYTFVKTLWDDPSYENPGIATLGDLSYTLRFRRITTNDHRLYGYTSTSTFPGEVSIPWIIVGNNRSFYLICGYQPSNPATHPDLAEGNKFDIQFFGDYNSYHGETTYNQIVICENSGAINNSIVDSTSRDNWASTGFWNGSKWRVRNNLITNDTSGVYARNNTQGGVGQKTYGLKYPYLDGNTYLRPVEILGEDGIVYGKLEGAYYSLHDNSVFDHSDGYQIIDGSGAWAGGQFLAVTSANGQVLIDLTSNWSVG